VIKANNCESGEREGDGGRAAYFVEIVDLLLRGLQGLGFSSGASRHGEMCCCVGVGWVDGRMEKKKKRS